MKILLISGSHPRHLYVHKKILEFYKDCSAIIMERESVLPEPPSNVTNRDRKLFVRHFDDRHKIEASVYGELSIAQVFRDTPHRVCKASDLNGRENADFARHFNADIAIIFGPDIIKSPLMDVLPELSINMHLGLSPWYRGSATLFWPFYFLQPQFAGVTFHKITAKADAGAILHQYRPELRKGQGIHDVGVNAVVGACNELIEILDNGISLKSLTEQRSSGRLFLTKDFQAAHLRLIYETFENRIVDAYLDGSLGDVQPKLVQHASLGRGGTN